MKKILYKAWSKFLTLVGDVKIFKFPMFIVYDPHMFDVTGEATLSLNELLKPGDVIIRGYSNYLDSSFVPSDEGWSHGAVYVGNGKIIHAVAEGVSEIDVIEFSRCDRIAILRPSRGQRKAIARSKGFLKKSTPYDFGFVRGCSALYCFELCAEAYAELDIKTTKKSTLFGLIKKDVYLAESFLNSPDFKLVYCHNPKYGIFNKRFKQKNLRRNRGGAFAGRGPVDDQ